MTTLVGDAPGGFTAAPPSPFDLGHGAYKLVAAHVNGDGRTDLIIGTEAHDTVTVLESDTTHNV